MSVSSPTSGTSSAGGSSSQPVERAVVGDNTRASFNNGGTTGDGSSLHDSPMTVDDMEEVLLELNVFERKITATSAATNISIPPLLDRYLQFVASAGNTHFPWTKIKRLYRAKLEMVINDFSNDFPTDDLPSVPNVDAFNFNAIKDKVFDQLEMFAGIPFTVQRLSELLTAPRCHYRRTDKFMRALEKNMLIVSTIDARSRRRSQSWESSGGWDHHPIVNGGDHHELTLTTTNNGDGDVDSRSPSTPPDNSPRNRQLSTLPQTKAVRSHDVVEASVTDDSPPEQVGACMSDDNEVVPSSSSISSSSVGETAERVTESESSGIEAPVETMEPKNELPLQRVSDGDEELSSTTADEQPKTYGNNSSTQLPHKTGDDIDAETGDGRRTAIEMEGSSRCGEATTQLVNDPLAASAVAGICEVPFSNSEDFPSNSTGSVVEESGGGAKTVLLSHPVVGGERRVGDSKEQVSLSTDAESPHPLAEDKKPPPPVELSDKMDKFDVENANSASMSEHVSAIGMSESEEKIDDAMEIDAECTSSENSIQTSAS